jgi:hypothetical protein
VAYADRWSRDNAKSKAGLEVLRDNGVKFFIGAVEQDLFDPHVRLVLGIATEINEFIAGNSSKKAMENKIERALKGEPSCGSMPWGRTWSPKDGWGIDEDKQARIVEVANRYLAGEKMKDLTAVAGLSHAQLWKVLRERSGEVWQQRFTSKRLNIDEVVPTPVPRLLPEELERKVRRRLADVKSRLRNGGKRVNDYLLSGYLFCGACGYPFHGQEDVHGKLHYQHTHHDKAALCPLISPLPWVPAKKLEAEVIGQLFDTFGNPALIARSVRDAAPPDDGSRARLKRLDADLGAVSKSRERILTLVSKDLVTEDQAAKELASLKEREALLKKDRDDLAAALEGVPDEAEVQCFVERCGSAIFVLDDDLNELPGGNDLGTFLTMTPGDKLALVHAVFANHVLGDGKPAGVYVLPDGPAVKYRPKKWAFRVRGRLDFELVVRFCRSERPTRAICRTRPRWPRPTACLPTRP